MGTAAARTLINALECTGFQSEVVTTSAKTLTVPSGAVMAVCKVEGEPLRYRVDGTSPTSATGVEAFAGDEIQIDGQDDMSAFEFIRHADSEPNGKLVCHYYK